jgi:hypothetical protein
MGTQRIHSRIEAATRCAGAVEAKQSGPKVDTTPNYAKPSQKGLAQEATQHAARLRARPATS